MELCNQTGNPYKTEAIVDNPLTSFILKMSIIWTSFISGPLSLVFCNQCTVQYYLVSTHNWGLNHSLLSLYQSSVLDLSEDNTERLVLGFVLALSNVPTLKFKWNDESWFSRLSLSYLTQGSSADLWGLHKLCCRCFSKAKPCVTYFPHLNSIEPYW